MEGIFQEFENENELRNYPFAAGCAQSDGAAYIPSGVFVDAALYPVNPTGTLHLSGVDADGVFSVSDASGVVMTGSASGACVELYDASGFGRHVGTLVASSAEALDEFARRGGDRTYTAAQAAFAASCVTPVVVDGVLSLSVGGLGPVDGVPSFANGASDDIRVSSSVRADGRRTLRFDVLPRPTQAEDGSIRRVICVVDGETPFRIQKLYDAAHPDAYGYDTVVLTLDGITRDDVCAAAHREDSLVMADTCSCEKPALPSEKYVPETYQVEDVYIPPDEDGSEQGVSAGSGNAFFLVVPNLPGEGNPLSVTLQDGAVLPDTEGVSTVLNGQTAEAADGELVDGVSSKGVVIQVPGLAGGVS